MWLFFGARDMAANWPYFSSFPLAQKGCFLSDKIRIQITWESYFGNFMYLPLHLHELNWRYYFVVMGGNPIFWGAKMDANFLDHLARWSELLRGYLTLRYVVVGGWNFSNTWEIHCSAKSDQIKGYQFFAIEKVAANFWEGRKRVDSTVGEEKHSSPTFCLSAACVRQCLVKAILVQSLRSAQFPIR